jgi:hypothetical protein
MQRTQKMLKNKIEKSKLTIGEDTDLNQLLNTDELSKSEQKSAAKNALIDIKKEIANGLYDLKELEDQYKDVTRQLNEDPAIIAYKELRKKINSKKKKLNLAYALWKGGIDMVKTLGIKLDKNTLKEIKEIKQQYQLK